MEEPMGGSITIIGGGIAGLATGCFAQMNGYQARIYEMHSLPGGLCTSWRRKGFMIDGCIHWLCGSGPGMSLYTLWEDLGAMEDLTYIHHRAHIHLELPDLHFTVYTDASELESYLLKLAPEDHDLICELAQAIRDFALYADPGKPEGSSPEAGAFTNKWMSIPVEEWIARIKNPGLREAFTILWGSGYPVFFALLSLGYANAHSAGYPVGGSLEFSRAIEHRFRELGGEIHYNARVKRIIVENDRAVGLELEDGTQVWEREGDIVSAADAHLTIFNLLESRYIDDHIKAWFEQVPVIQSPLQITIGVDWPLENAPTAIGGILFPPAEPFILYGQEVKLIGANVFNFDPTAAPQGKAVIKVELWGNYDFWKKLSETPDDYEAEKDRITQQVVQVLDQRFPGLSDHVEMVDIATPLTFERYTANWLGSSQGWVPTAQSMGWVREAAQEGRWPASRTLPGLSNFYMAGQWLEPFGGVPTAALSGRGLIEMLCARDGKTFITSRPSQVRARQP
jgi:phytoene dehydrogenase-like protein